MLTKTTPEIKKQIGQKLASLRGLLGIDLTAFARVLGISTSTASHLENGNNDPSFLVLYILRKRYRMSIDDMIDELPNLNGGSGE